MYSGQNSYFLHLLIVRYVWKTAKICFNLDKKELKQQMEEQQAQLETKLKEGILFFFNV